VGGNRSKNSKLSIVVKATLKLPSFPVISG
jgi:hypothetical protein